MDNDWMVCRTEERPATIYFLNKNAGIMYEWDYEKYMWHTFRTYPNGGYSNIYLESLTEFIDALNQGLPICRYKKDDGSNTFILPNGHVLDVEVLSRLLVKTKV